MDRMEPKIIDSKPIVLMGMSFYGDPFDSHAGWDEENQIGLLWKRYMAFLQKNPSPGGQKPTSPFYEVHIYNETTREKGLFEIFVGSEQDPDAITTIPVDLCVKILPATLYAVFTFHGQEIVGDWEKAITDWLANSAYTSAGMYNFQYYTDQFKGFDRLDESSLDVYFPVRKLSE
jgi:predicted transcriptional regulator YdeE